MQVGELYTVTPGYYLFRGWKGLPALYLGEEIIERPDGRPIINYLFLVGGQRRLADRSLLKHLKPLTSS